MFPVIWTTGTSNFGAANASTLGNKEAANSSNMTSLSSILRVTPEPFRLAERTLPS